MLDFYFIADETIKPYSPSGLEIAGALDDKTFANLQKKGIIDDRFDFYSDFRWNEALLKQMRERIVQKQLHTDTDVVKLLRLIDTAIKNQNGLIAFGD